jgi:hypothetical protein
MSIAQEEKSLTEQHLYHNSVSCVNDVLGGSFGNFSMIAIALVISLLF